MDSKCRYRNHCSAKDADTNTSISSCCPSGSTCQYAANNQVGCCSASSGKCAGSLSGGNAYHSTSQYVAPAATTTAYNGGGAVVVGNNNPTTTVVQQGGFCTTLIAKGDNLPTTAEARCGTALVIEAGASRGKGRVVGMVLVLQVLGAWFVVRRW